MGRDSLAGFHRHTVHLLPSCIDALCGLIRPVSIIPFLVDEAAEFFIVYEEATAVKPWRDARKVSPDP